MPNAVTLEPRARARRSKGRSRRRRCSGRSRSRRRSGEGRGGPPRPLRPLRPLRSRPPVDGVEVESSAGVLAGVVRRERGVGCVGRGARSVGGRRCRCPEGRSKRRCFGRRRLAAGRRRRAGRAGDERPRCGKEHLPHHRSLSALDTHRHVPRLTLTPTSDAVQLAAAGAHGSGNVFVLAFVEKSWISPRRKEAPPSEVTYKAMDAQGAASPSHRSARSLGPSLPDCDVAPPPGLSSRMLRASERGPGGHAGLDSFTTKEHGLVDPLADLAADAVDRL